MMSMKEEKFYASKVGAKNNVSLKIKRDACSPPKTR